MGRLEVVKKIAVIEEKKKQFEALLSDVEDYYFEHANITVDVISKAFPHNRKYDGSVINVNKQLFKDYLKREIEKLKIESDDIVNEVLK